MSEAPRIKPLNAEELKRRRQVHTLSCGCQGSCLDARTLATLDAERERADVAEGLLRDLDQRHAMRAALESMVEHARSDIERDTLAGQLARLDAVLGKESSRE